MNCHLPLKQRRFQKLVGEVLERRTLLCGLPHTELIRAPEFDWAVENTAQERSGSGDAVSIVWSNRGQASDGFAAAFGTSAEAGRAVVDAVFTQWSRIISSFNRSDGTSSLQVNLSITTGFGFGAAGGPASTAPSDGKPRTGSITISRGNNDGVANNSNGWFFDPTPMDNSEFMGNINHAYNARATNVSQGVDFFSVVNLELAHVLGIISDKDNNAANGFNGYLLENMTTATGIRDNAEGGGSFGFFYVFDGPNIDHLMTGYNSGDATSASWGNVIHTSGGGNINFSGRNWIGINDDSNALYDGGERVIPSFVVARILGDAYGYSIIDPANFATMHTVLNQNTRTLTVRGGQAATSSDVIVIDTSGGDLLVTVDVGDDVAGSGALPGAGNLPAYVTRVPLSSVDSIVINGGGARDYLRLERIGGKLVTINGGDGDDFIDFTFYSRHLDNLGSGSVYITGGTGADFTYVYDDNNTVADTFKITSSRFERPFWSGFTYASDIEGLTLITGTGANTVNVESTWPGQPVVLNSTGGLETINIGTAASGVQNIRADVQVNNSPLYSTININNGADTGNRNWLINDVNTSYGSIGGLAPALITWNNSDIDAINLTTGSGVDTGTIARLSETLNINNAASNPGGVYDQITLGHSTANGMQSLFTGRQGGITIDNNPSYTRLIFDDTGNFGVRNALLDLVAGYNHLTGLAPATIRFDDIDIQEVTLKSGGAADTVTVARYSAVGGLVLNSAGGADTVNLGNSTDGVLSIFAPVTVRNTPAFSTLNLNNNFDTTARFVTIDYNEGLDLQSISGLGPATHFWDPGDISTSGGVNITTGSGRDTVSVLANERTLNLATAGSAGEEVIIGPDLERIDAEVYVRNAPNFTAVTINDTANVAGRFIEVGSSFINGESFSAVYGFGAVIYLKTTDIQPPVTLNSGSGADTLSIITLLNSFTVNTGGSADTVHLGSQFAGLRSLDPLNASLTVNGGAGDDSLYINDQDYGAGGGITVGPTLISSNHSSIMTHSDFGVIDVNLSNAGESLVVTDTLPTFQVRIHGGAGHDVIDVHKASSTVAMTPSAGLDDLSADTNDNGSPALVLLWGSAFDLGTVSIGNGGYLHFDAETSMRVTQLNMLGGRLNLANGSLLVNYSGATPVAAVRNALLAGRNGGAWNGSSGILSSIIASQPTFSIGYAEASQVRSSFPATFGAFSDVDNTTVLVRYTLQGDANLDRNVNFDDLLLVAQNYNTGPNKVWSQGDFDYTGLVAFDDLLILAQRYGSAFAVDWQRANSSPSDGSRRGLASRMTLLDHVAI